MVEMMSRSTPSDPSLVASAPEQQPPPQPASVSPGNAAMEALRRWRPPVKGATPTAPPDDPSAGGRHQRAMLAALLVNISAGTTLGYASVSMSGIELEPWYSLQHTTPENQWVADILLLGAAAGALLSGFLLHLLGHRRTLLLSAFGLVNAWICIVVSNSVTMLFIGRVTCGIWLGVSTNSVNLYIIDVAPAAKRTFFGGLTEVALSVGMLAPYVLGGLAWQISAILYMLAPVPVFVLQSYIVESPRWFAAKGRYRDANTAMVRLYGDDVPADFRYSRTGEDSNMSTMGRQKVARMLTVSMLLSLLRNMSCAQLVLLRAVQVVGPLVDVMSPQEAACLLFAMHVSCTMMFAALTRYIGRRQLLVFSSALVAGVLSTLRPFDHVVFSEWSPEAASGTKWGALCSVFLLVLAYSTGLCHVPPMVISELLPLKRWRFLSASALWVWRWLIAFVIVHFHAYMLGTGEYRSLSAAFGLALLLVAAAAIPFVPETEGRTLNKRYNSRRSSGSAASAARVPGSDLTENASNAAMEELRNLQPPAKGGSPVTDTDAGLQRGVHVRTMLAACLGSCAAATTLGFASVAMPSIEHETWYNLTRSDPPDNHWLADSLMLGAAGGALLSGLTLWKCGSRNTILTCAVGLSVSWIVTAACVDLVVMFVARVLCGLWLGLITICVSLYVAEVAPSEKRAFYTGLTEAATCFGIAASCLVDGLSWRLQATVWAAVSLSLLGVQRYLIECPRWLHAHGRAPEADTAAARLYGMDLPQDLRHSSKAPDGTARSTSQRRALLRRLSACLVLHLLQGATLTQLFMSRGMQTMASLVAEIAAPLATLVMTTMQAAFVVVFAALTRCAGRRHLVCVSTALIAVCFVIVPPFEYLKFRQWDLGGAPTETSWVAVYSVNLLVLSYSVGLCHVPALLTAEMCPGAGYIHYIGAPVVWAVRWLLAFVVLHYDEGLLAFALQDYMSILIALILVVLCGVAIYLTPETEGRTLADMERTV
ncbi:hypothetical protein MTO96_006341 [Rhipicephalus appendiculatus]